MLAEIASALTMLGCVTSAAVCTRLMLRQMREMVALEAENARLASENAAYARTVVASVLRGRMPPRLRSPPPGERPNSSGEPR